ncbi:hypothetical protein CYY_009466 [Polysphondylium violaceum]|uniref:IPT/TIG domain-containing protein n=1 Tax=Polysphondylium violaceum TaxID=133409 RepID=A0A8J4PLH0_9MYCE|nr:hypothetical protein CYY_009466 [Polysphondylium violaceum]
MNNHKNSNSSNNIMLNILNIIVSTITVRFNFKSLIYIFILLYINQSVFIIVDSHLMESTESDLQHNCIYDQLSSSNNVFSGSGRANSRNLQSLDQATDTLASGPLTLNNTDPIRIFLYTDSLLAQNDPDYTCRHAGDIINSSSSPSVEYTCKDVDVLTREKLNYLIGTILKRAIEILSGTLYTRRLTTPIYFNGKVCGTNIAGPIAYPDSYTTQGVDADLVLLVTARPIQSSNVLAFGYDCQINENDKKTRIGQLNFNPASISTQARDYNFQVGVALHEISHVLGFSKERFQNIPGLTNLTALKYTSSDGTPLSTWKIISPKVLAYVRSHFNCDSLDGAELEDQGGIGTAFSHWEKRIFDNEYMTGTASNYPIFSKLTLALFEDLGFYAVNYTYASKPLVWGYGLGCRFASQPCNTWKNEKLYCTATYSKSRCTYDRIAKGQCTVQKAKVPAEFDYLGDGNGGDVLPDYCPSIDGYPNLYCVDNSTNNNQSGGYFFQHGEVFGADSRCFESSLIKTSPISLSTEARCYQTACLGNSRLKIKIDSFWYDCPYGSSIEIEGYSGNIQCPNGDEVCIEAPIDNTWPTFTSVQPTSARPKDNITITGTNFNNNTYVVIDSHDCSHTYLVNSTQLIVTISDKYVDPTSLISSKVNIYIVDKETSRNAVGIKALDFQVELNKQYLEKVGDWLMRHWYVPVIAGLALIGLTVLLYRCCVRRRAHNKKKAAYAEKKAAKMKNLNPHQ